MQLKPFSLNRLSRNGIHNSFMTQKNPPRCEAGFDENRCNFPLARGYFCQVRFLWRLAFKRFLRLCLFIWRRRFFLRLPMWSQV